jgi:cytochrome c oxidase subunit 3
VGARGHGAAAHPAHAHHFDSLDQQNEASSLGMWVFLVTEILFFGGAFLAYIVYRSAYPEAFAGASHHLDITLGAINTAVLIFSSLTMAVAVRSAQLGRRNATVLFLLATMLLGSAFLVIKVIEYGHKFRDNLFPGPGFVYPEGPARQAELFFSIYFAMTGLHALHMIIGIGLLGVLVLMARKRRFTPEYYSPVENIGLYWHFVDIVWIFLFPLLYLIGRHG